MTSFKTFKMNLQPLLTKRNRKLASSPLGCKPTGDCFIVAGKNILHATIPTEANPRLVHAIVTGEGKQAGKKLHHAWNEIGDVVIDHSEGRKVMMRKEQYYKQAKVVQKKGKYASYSAEEVFKKLAKHKHWGPWDLDE